MPVLGFTFLPSGNMVFWLALVPVFMLALMKLYRQDGFLSGSPYEFLFESSFILAGLLAVVI